MSETETEAKNLFWHRVKLLALIGIFVSPFVAGWMALYVFELRPESGNYGQLVQPPRKIDWPDLTDVDGVTHRDGFGRKWTLILFAGNGCGEACRGNLFYMRQIRTLLGRDTQRLQNLFVTGQPLSEETRLFLRDYPHLVVVENNRNPALYEAFELEGSEAVGREPRLFLVDPDRNFMMHYPAQFDQDLVLDDIRKLLKLSRIG